MTVNKFLTIEYWKRRGLHCTPSERLFREAFENEVYYVAENPDEVIWEFVPEMDKKEPIITLTNQHWGHKYKTELLYVGNDLYVAKSIQSYKDKSDEDLVAAGFEKIPKDVLSMEVKS